MKEVIKQMVDTYGEKQIIVAIEELSELTKELCKSLRGQTNTQNIIEEIADCYIVLQEMKELFKISNYQLREEIDKKLERTKSRYLCQVNT